MARPPGSVSCGSGARRSAIAELCSRWIAHRWGQAQLTHVRARFAFASHIHVTGLGVDPDLVSPSCLTDVTTVYTVAAGDASMAVIHVRKVGNSSVVTLPPEVLAQANLRDGDLVQPRVDRAGRIVLEAVTVTPREARRAIIRNAARRDRAVLRRLAEYD